MEPPSTFPRERADVLNEQAADPAAGRAVPRAFVPATVAAQTTRLGRTGFPSAVMRTLALTVVPAFGFAGFNGQH